jgi:hypothetical protein
VPVPSTSCGLLKKRISNSESLTPQPSYLTQHGIRGAEMKPVSGFSLMLKQKGCSDKAIKEIWKWYDFSERKGINF